MNKLHVYPNNNLSNVSDRFYVRTSETDFNRLTKSGYYFGKLTQNTPDGTTDSNWIAEVQAFDNSTGWTFQRAARSSDKAIFTRIQDNGTWSDWEVLARKSDLSDFIVSRQISVDVTIPNGSPYSISEYDITCDIPSGYKYAGILRAWCIDPSCFVSNAYFRDEGKNAKVNVSNLNGTQKNTRIFISVLYAKS